MVTTHHVRRYASERGHHASCSCGWRIVHVQRQVVADASNRHLADTIVTTTEEDRQADIM